MASSQSSILQQIKNTKLGSGNGVLNAPGLGGGTKKEKTDKEKVVALKEQIAKKEKELGKKHKNAPSILSRVFDVLSRGNYASAEAVHRGKQYEAKGKHDLLGTIANVGSGFVGGLTGKKKTTFSDVLEKDYHVKNPIVKAVGGFIGDVALDPTTYIGTGLVGKGKNVAELAKVGGETAKVATKSKEAIKAGQTAVNLAQKAGTLNTAGKTAKQFAKEIRTVHKSGVQDYAVKAGEAAKVAAKESNKPALAIKFAGRPVVKSEKAYNVGKDIIDRVNKSSIGDAFGELMRPTHTFKHGTNVIKRRSEAVAAHHFEQEAFKIGEEFHSLTKAEKLAMQHSLRVGIPVTGISKHGEDLGVKAKRVLEIDEDIFNRRKALGLESKKAKYDPVKAISAFKESEGVDHFLVYRLNSLHNQAGRKSLSDELGNTFGVKTSKTLAEKQGLVPSKARYAPKNTYFHPDIAKALEFTDKTFGNPDAAKKLLKTYDTALGVLKTSQTVVNPGHQAQNLLGDVYKSAIDGLVNPTVYKDAGKAVQGVGKIGIKGKTFTGEEILKAYNEVGGDVGLITSDILKKGRVPVLQGIKKFSQKRENFARIAHFIHAVREHPGPITDFESLLEAGKEAIIRVNHFHFDYGDKTKFEKEALSRVIPFYCVDVETELLSKRGWLNHEQIEIGDIIYTLNLKTGLGEWQEVDGLFKEHFEGRLVSLESREMSALVTLDHKWPVTSQYRPNVLKLKKTSLLNSSDRIPLARAIEDTQGYIYTDDFVELMGWIICEGHYKPKGSTIEISQSWYANPEKVKEIKSLLQKMKAHWHEFNAGVGKKITYFGLTGALAYKIRELFPNKTLTMEFVNSLTASQRELLINTMVKADGNFMHDNRCFVSNKKETVDSFVAMCALSGHATYTVLRKESKCYQITIKLLNKCKYVNLQETYKVYSNYVWCPHTRNETFYARRNGKVYWTGNTWVRKNIPNELENLIQRPGRVAVVPKIGRNVEAALGTRGQEEGIIPKYVREAFPVKIGKDKFLNPNLPIADLGKFFEGNQAEWLRHQISNTSPIIRFPVERAFEKSLFTGAPNKDSNVTYLGSQVPLARLLLNEINKKGLTDDQKINYLTSAGLRIITDKSKASELRRIKSMLDAAVRKQKGKKKPSTGLNPPGLNP